MTNTITKNDYFKSEINSKIRILYRKIFKKPLHYCRVNHKKVITDSRVANSVISYFIESNMPFFVGRFGSVEMSIINEYYKIQLGFQSDYSATVKKTAMFNAGIFSNTKNDLDYFSKIMLNSIETIDCFGLWNDRQELLTVKKYAKQCIPMLLFCLEPYYDVDSSWTHALKNKKVLIIHPFVETIKEQFQNKNKLFTIDFWPECEWKYFKAVQTIAGTKDERFANWSEALEYMKAEISCIDFDIAIIGCGAYGFPLAAYIKSIGKQAIHLGGATQLLFGIKGKRWEQAYVSRFFNRFWKRPSSSEKPKESLAVENGCYW